MMVTKRCRPPPADRAPLRKRKVQVLRGCERRAAADWHPSIGALFVFLDLLKGQSEGLTQLFLAHVEHHAPHTQPASDVLVDRIWNLDCHPAPKFGLGLA